MKFKDHNILFIAPHTDDVELGCGATLARCIDEGANVHVAAFSSARKSLPAGSYEDQLRDEFYAAMSIYDLAGSSLTVLDFEVRTLSYHRQEVLDTLINLKCTLEPSMVFIPSCNDTHQDHMTVNQESLRAFKSVNLFGYELPWNHFEFSGNAFIEVGEDQINRKLLALSCYKTQLEKKRPYFDEDFIRGLARVRGVQVGCKYAESFEIIRMRW